MLIQICAWIVIVLVGGGLLVASIATIIENWEVALETFVCCIVGCVALGLIYWAIGVVTGGK